MAAIRQLEFTDFRRIANLSWKPGAGINDLIRPGDSGKSTLLDAIDLVLAPRRTASFADADFTGLDTAAEIRIAATIGDVPEALLELERYGIFHRGWDRDFGISDEPEQGDEIVVTIRLTVGADLDPRWAL